MKNLFSRTVLVTVCFAFLAVCTQAQTEKGRFTVGASVANASFSNTTTSFGINPSFGYFLADDLMVGTSLNFNYYAFSNEFFNDRSTSVGAGPFVRYYFGSGRLKPLLAAEFSYNRQVGEANPVSSSILAGSGGAAYFINDNVALEGLAGYNHILNRDIQNR
ncbi:MAG: porin family protein, partial [Cytophagales bacterium]|nr:porin family protein [Cytophagales bacterium]